VDKQDPFNMSCLVEIVATSDSPCCLPSSQRKRRELAVVFLRRPHYPSCLYGEWNHVVDQDQKRGCRSSQFYTVRSTRTLTLNFKLCPTRVSRDILKGLLVSLTFFENAKVILVFLCGLWKTVESTSAPRTFVLITDSERD
jgi:hypothetical protein